MLRQGEISQSLHDFRGYQVTARSLERLKRQLRTTKQQVGKERIGWCIDRCEEILDRAWDDVAEIERTRGDTACQLVVRHFLFDEGWHDVAADMGIPYDKAKKIAYTAIKSLDSMSVC